MPFVGGTAVQESSLALHVHVVFGFRDGSTVGGYLQRLHVWPTLEVVVTETPSHLAKRADKETGLALISMNGQCRW